MSFHNPPRPMRLLRPIPQIAPSVVVVRTLNFLNLRDLNMEIDITDFFNNATPSYYSASVHELGPEVDRITWENAVDRADDLSLHDTLLDTEEKRDAFRAFVRSSGGWSDTEIQAWDNIELEALFIQWISGDMREANIAPPMSEEDWADYEQASSEGQVPSNIFRGTDGRIYFYVGS